MSKDKIIYFSIMASIFFMNIFIVFRFLENRTTSIIIVISLFIAMTSDKIAQFIANKVQKNNR